MKIGLSDLAGLDALEEPEEFVENMKEIMSRRNIGVSDNHYSSNRNLNALNRLKGSGGVDDDKIPDRTYSASAAFCSPIINVRHDVVDITSLEDEQQNLLEDELASTTNGIVCAKDKKNIETKPTKPKPAVAPKPKSMKQKPQPQNSLSSANGSNNVVTASSLKRTSDVATADCKNTSKEVKQVNSSNNTTKSAAVQRSVSVQESCTSSSKLIQLPNSEMFYAPTTLPKTTKPTITTTTTRRQTSRSHLEQIGERHLSRRKSSSLQSLQDRALNRTFSQPIILSIPRPPQRCNSSTVTTRFDGNLWDISLAKRKPLTGKSTMV